MPKPKSFNFTVENGEKERLDIFLKKRFPYLSRSFIQKLIIKGKVTVEGEVSKPAYFLKGGERIMATFPLLLKSSVKGEPIPLDVLWEDDFLLVVNKPAGMLTHPTGFGQSGTLVNALLFHCHHLSHIGGELRQGIVHRLDRDTSGLLVVAKDDETHLALISQFKKRIVKKVYIALVRGRPSQDKGSIEAEIGRSYRKGTRMSLKGKNPRKAKTGYQVLKEWGKWSLLKLSPETGRTHQIRLHLHCINCFLIGDSFYGGKKGREFPYKVRRGMLHAQKLSFLHPQRKEWMEFEAPLPQDMKEAIKILGEIRGRFSFSFLPF